MEAFEYSVWAVHLVDTANTLQCANDAQVSRDSSKA